MPATIVVAITPLVIVESVDLDITAAFTSALTLAALLPVLVTRVDQFKRAERVFGLILDIVAVCACASSPLLAGTATLVIYETADMKA